MSRGDVPQEVWVAFAGWIRHIDGLLAKSDQRFRDAEHALRRAGVDQPGHETAIVQFGEAFGEAHGHVINARRDLASALARGLNPPSNS